MRSYVAIFTSLVASSSVFGITGFGGDGTGWQLNGGATVTADVLNLTQDGGTNAARSAFYATALPADAFQVRFTYSNDFSDGTFNPADGFTFTIQNDPRGATAVGGGGAGL